jgi:hypothetical protein
MLDYRRIIKTGHPNLCPNPIKIAVRLDFGIKARVFRGLQILSLTILNALLDYQTRESNG